MWKQGVYRSEGRKEQTKKWEGSACECVYWGILGGGGIIY